MAQRAFGIRMAVAWWLVAGLPGSVTAIQDVLVVDSERTGQTVNRRGTIVEWRGNTITLEGRARTWEVDADTVREVQTEWPDGYLQGRQLLEQRQFAAALVPLRQALADEQRPWARRTIGASLIEGFLATGNWLAATREFLAITRDDPQTRFFNLAPLPWVSTVGQNELQNQAARWMVSDEPVEQLLGAAWSLGGNRRNEALEVLGRLSREAPRPEVAALALAQRWRTASTSADAETVQRWASQAAMMPPAVRGGAYLMVADGLARNEQPEQAALYLMRIAILYPEQYELAACGLYRCAVLRQNAGLPEQAATLYRELVRDFGNTLWAQQAAARLEQLASEPTGNR